MGKNSQQTQQSESRFLNHLAKLHRAKIAVFVEQPSQTKIPYFKLIQVKSVSAEEALAQRYGIGYKRFYITDRCRSTDNEVNKFVTFVKPLPKQTWLHFH